MLKRFFDVTFFSICVNLILPVTLLSVQYFFTFVFHYEILTSLVGRVNSQGITDRR